MLAQASQDIDANHRTIATNDAFRISKTVAFTGATGNGEVGSVSLFTVTGDVLVRVFGTCTESIAGASATLAVGTASNTGGILASQTATNIAAGDIVLTGSAPAQVGALGSNFVVAGGTDVIATVGTANITDGTITWYCLWRPLSTDGNVGAA